MSSKSPKPKKSDSKKPKKTSDSKKGKSSDAEKGGDSFPVKYHINVEAISATKLIAADKNGTSDPYVVIELEGGKQKFMTNFIENSLNPTWNEILEPLDGYFVSSDLIHIWIYDKDRKVDLKKNDCIAYAKLNVSDIGNLGTVVTKEIQLYNVTKDKKAGIWSQSKKSHRGDAGILTLKFHVAQLDDKPFVENPWESQFLEACLELHDAKNCPIMGEKSSDPYVIMTIEPAANKQQYKTIVQKNTLNPVWNEVFRFCIDDPKTQKIHFTMYHDTKEMGSTTISLENLNAGEIADFETQLQIKDGKKTGGVLGYRTTIVHKGEEAFHAPKEEPKKEKKEKKEKAPKKEKEPEPIPEVKERDVTIDSNEHCSFSWGTYSSSYSTNFSGYTVNSSTLSDFHSSEEHYHVHKIVKVQEYHEKPKQAGVKGKLINCTDLIKTENSGTDAFCQISLRNKSDKVKGDEFTTETIENTQNPEFNKEFTFKDAKKGEVLHIGVYQKFAIIGKVMIGYATYPVKDIKDNQTLTLDLQKPPKFSKTLGKHTEFGHCTLEVSTDFE